MACQPTFKVSVQQAIRSIQHFGRIFLKKNFAGANSLRPRRRRGPLNRRMLRANRRRHAAAPASPCRARRGIRRAAARPRTRSPARARAHRPPGGLPRKLRRRDARVFPRVVEFQARRLSISTSACLTLRCNAGPRASRRKPADVPVSSAAGIEAPARCPYANGAFRRPTGFARTRRSGWSIWKKTLPRTVYRKTALPSSLSGYTTQFSWCSLSN